MPKKIEISHRTIVFTVILILGLWLLYLIKDIIFTLYISVLVMAVLNPAVNRLEKHKISRSISVIIVYILLVLLAGITVAALIPSLIAQTTSFINNFPRLVSNLGLSALVSEQILQQFVAQLGTLPSRIAVVLVSLFSNVLAIVTILVFAFYLLTDRYRLEGYLSELFGTKSSKDVVKFINRLEKRLGSWARAQLTLMVAIASANFIGLTLLGVPFALPLSILAGILEIVPYIGPVIAAAPAVIIGFGISPVIGLATASLAFLVQQLENYVLVPKIMQKATGVNPIVTLLSLAIGFRLAGILGLLIAVPVFLTIQTSFHYFYSKAD